MSSVPRGSQVSRRSTLGYHPSIQGRDSELGNIRRKSSETDAEGRPLLNKCVSQIIKPLRVLEFLALMLIFIHVIFAAATEPSSLSYFVIIVLLSLTGAYLFAAAVDLISQFSDNKLRVLPSTLFAAVGIFFYTVIAIGLMSYLAPVGWLVLSVIILCFLLAIFYMIDVLMIFLFWKRTCENCEYCDSYCPPKGEVVVTTAPAYRESTPCQCMIPETVKAEMATSVSNVQVSGATLEPDHSSRKISYARRRQYADCCTSARSSTAVGSAQVQTQASGMKTIEVQTSKSEFLEKPVQTVSKCDLCHRQLESYEPLPTRHTSTQQGTFPLCPAFMQLMRGGTHCVGSDAPVCRCVAGVVQVQDSVQQRGMDQQIQLVQCVEPNICGSLTSEKSSVARTSPDKFKSRVMH